MDKSTKGSLCIVVVDAGNHDEHHHCPKQSPDGDTRFARYRGRRCGSGIQSHASFLTSALQGYPPA